MLDMVYQPSLWLNIWDIVIEGYFWKHKTERDGYGTGKRACDSGEESV